MATIPEHVKNLLFEQDCVVIPEFGGFISNFDSASFLANGSVLPPRKRLVFNEMLQFDDGLLSNYLAKVENCSREESKYKLKSFVEKVRKDIRIEKQFEFGQLGVFTENIEGKLVFEPEGKINFHGESFGLGEFRPAYKRVTTDQPQVSTPVTERSANDTQRSGLEVVYNGKQVRRWAAAAAVVLVAFLGIWFTGQKTTLSSLNPVTALDFSWLKSAPAEPQAEMAAVTTPVAVVASKPVVTSVVKEEVPAEEGNTNKFVVVSSKVRNLEGEKITSGYFIVAGSFGSIKSAKVMKQQLEDEGFQIQLIKPKYKGMIKVVIGTKMDTSEESQKMAQKLGDHFNNNLWILKAVQY